ncbi:type II toxin-antitoxin system PemK/MazF family toxin [Bosea sp. 124]|uniref:type II toxin-antitoxin system PemK/MazF family toxin n=1 Tax=Bosea sp. 124 TaxID=2135642 RepID=UPI000D34D977|nr:type II toxin-antitoxin system PemK/MazF family toxin [Bosea sp. 124]PTM42268.1 transcriptional modulator of MazE/toxin MazF [Bosea sp. 124]
MTTTTRASGHPESGEVYWVDLDPVLGSEQAGRQPVVLMSDDALHQFSSRILICPITWNPEPWPTKAAVPSGCVVSGFVLTDQARIIDRDFRKLRLIGRLPEAVTLRVKHRVAAYMSIIPITDSSPL